MFPCLQGVIQREKEEWEKKRDQEQYVLEQERAELDAIKTSLAKQEVGTTPATLD